MSMIGIDAEETACQLEAHAEFAGADLLRQMDSQLRAEESENARLRKVIAHLITNPLNTTQHACRTSDITAQTGRVEITDVPGTADNSRTIIRITEQ